MKPQIMVLPPAVVDQIAAGEVVERPASVVKELLENALDAGSTEVVVRTEMDGTAGIEVNDNGSGMDLEDAVLAVERHATSKIRTLQDLESLQSLGFRGEALSSIASVSRMEIATRRSGALEGARLYLEAGKVVEKGPWGCAVGTRVSVEDLFFNVPARRKFLRSKQTESHHMRDVLERTAMMRWDIGFTYEHDGKRALDCPAANDWSERIRQIWGDALVRDLFPVRHSGGDVVIEGYLSHPNRHRNTAAGLWLYVNGRAIFDRGFLHAVMLSYGPLMEKGRYPTGVLQITLPSNDVDVNVHPTKREVRFRDPRKIFDGVISAVKRLLRDQPWISHLKGDRTETGFHPLTSGSADKVSESIMPFAGNSAPKPMTKGFHEPGLFRDETESPMAEMRYLGSVEDTYLVFSTREGLQIIDQHAAHERILFERLKAQWREDRENQGQGLLWAEVVELPSDRQATIERLIAPLASLGWLIEPFGGNTWRMKTVPPWINPGEASNVLFDLLEECAQIGLEGREEDFIHRMLAQLACRTSVKGRSRVVEREALELARRLRQTPEMGLCPHGRPTIVEIPLAELRRRFKRN